MNITENRNLKIICLNLCLYNLLEKWCPQKGNHKKIKETKEGKLKKMKKTESKRKESENRRKKMTVVK